jgi:hypothetical protein
VFLPIRLLGPHYNNRECRGTNALTPARRCVLFHTTCRGNDRAQESHKRSQSLSQARGPRPDAAALWYWLLFQHQAPKT